VARRGPRTRQSRSALGALRLSLKGGPAVARDDLHLAGLRAMTFAIAGRLIH